MATPSQLLPLRAVAQRLARHGAAQRVELRAQCVGHGGQAQREAGGLGPLLDHAGRAHALVAQVGQFALCGLFGRKTAEREAVLQCAACPVVVHLAGPQFGAFAIQRFQVFKAAHVDHPAARDGRGLQQPAARRQVGGGGTQGVGLAFVKYTGLQAFGGIGRGGGGSGGRRHVGRCGGRAGGGGGGGGGGGRRGGGRGFA